MYVIILMPHNNPLKTDMEKYGEVYGGVSM